MEEVTVKVDDTEIISKKVINVLGVLFNNRLSWSQHIRMDIPIQKSNKALNAIKLIRKYFKTKELQQQLTSNFFLYLHNLKQHDSILSFIQCFKSGFSI
jgi:hypothetical protein